MDDNIKKTELLAPAGDFESVKAAINAGADSIYIGLEKFGARAFAKGTEDKDFAKKSIKYAHDFGKKIFLTLNTLVKDNEFNELEKILSDFDDGDFDAFIVQDLGVFDFLNKKFKKTKFHASTQMNITSKEGVILLSEMGFERCILARELDFDEIKEIKNNIKTEIECFIHGSMCYSYSGCCLMSSFFGNNSGNRGRCKGTCRLKYEFDNQNKYFLSMKDMCSLSYLYKLCNIGIDSLKIEGRMRSPVYVARTVSIYRKYLNDIYNKKFDLSHINEDIKKLKEVYDKGGYTYYFDKKNSKEMIQTEEKEKKNLNNKIYNQIKEEYVNCEKKVYLNLDIIFKIGENIRGRCMNCENKKIYDFNTDIIPEIAKTKAITREQISNQLNKTGSTIYEFKNINIKSDENIFLPISKLNEIRRQIIDKL